MMFAWLKRRGDAAHQVKKALGDVELPSFPVVVSKAMRMLRDPNAELALIGDQVSADPGASGRLLRVANSTTFALRNPVRSVAHAVSLLGRSEVESLLLAIVVGRTVPQDTPEGFDRDAFWHAAARRAAVARRIATDVSPRSRSECFTAALLQDMAIPFLAREQGAPYGQLLADWRAEGFELETAERDAFGWDHALIAGWMAEKWEFPEVLAAAIAGHHDSQGAPNPVSLVASLGEGDLSAERDALIERAARAYGVGLDDAVIWIDEGFENAHEIAAQLLAA